MTVTTLKRQLDLLVGGILKSYKIDNLQLEIDISSSVYRMISEGEKDPAKWVSIREDILAKFLAGAQEENEIAEMEGRITAAMNFNIDGRSSFTSMVKFVIRMEKEKGQTIEQFASWCRQNPYDAPKFFQIAAKPDLLIRNWPAAFANVPPEPKNIMSGTTGFYA